MKDFFDYLTSGVSDKQWGMYLTVVGRYHAPAHELYPSKTHPSGYYFEWESGRILDEYQLNYITAGSGIIQTNAGEFLVESGSMILIQPGVKHRYKPNELTGWREHYIGFNGKLATHFIDQTFGSTDNPVIQVGHHVDILDSYQKIIDLVTEQKPAYHQIASGLILKTLGYINSHLRRQNIANEAIEALVNKAKAFMWENVNHEADLKLFSKQHNISYSYFRKAFKMYTGLAPHQFFLDLKMMRAKELLVASDMSVKAVTYELGFDSIHYFSRIFKKKMGISPSELMK